MSKWRRFLAAGALGTKYPSEAVSGWASTLWGFWILDPYHAALISRSYGFMLAIAPEPYWGLLFLLMGLAAQLGAWKQVTNLRRWGMMGIFLLRSFIAVSVLLSNPTSPGLLDFTMWAVLAGWSYLKIGYRAHHE